MSMLYATYDKYKCEHISGGLQKNINCQQLSLVTVLNSIWETSKQPDKKTSVSELFFASLKCFVMLAHRSSEL